MTDCVIVQPIAAAGIDRLRAAGLSVFIAPGPALEDMAGPLATARAVITRNAGFSRRHIAAAPHLRVIGVHGTGTDRVDVQTARARGIAVLNTPGTNALAVAEHALALMLALAKALGPADAALRGGNFGFRDGAPVFELAGRRLGLLGWGRVARHLAGMGAALGMRVAVCSAHADGAELAALGIQSVADADRLCGMTDVLSLHGLAAAAPVIDARRIALMPPGALLINTARGALVDSAALVSALCGGRLGGAGIDVFATEPPPADDPLLAPCPNLILTPHIGGSAQEALDRTALAVAGLVLERLQQEGG